MGPPLAAGVWQGGGASDDDNAAVCQGVLLGSAVFLSPHSASSHTVLRGEQRMGVPLPLELWEMIFAHFERRDFYRQVD